MKVLIHFTLMLLLLSAVAFEKKRWKYSDANTKTGSLNVWQEKKGDTDDWEKLLKSLDCNDANYEKDRQALKKSIEFQLNSMIKKLSLYKKDTMRSKPLIAALNQELKTYEATISNEASMLFWSYGVASMQGERVVSRNCYYLTALRKKLTFIKALSQKMESSFL